MLTTVVISFREFLEAFLIVGVFLGICKKLHLKKEFEIILATIIGITISLLLATSTYLFSNQIHKILTEENTEIFESYLLIFSGVFIIYTIFSLHSILNKAQSKIVSGARQKLNNNIFDVSLFFTVVFLVIREGFEIALFTASTAILSVFIQNFIGLIIGFILASIFSVLIFFTYIELHIKKILRITEYIIILLGTSMILRGIIKLFIH